MYRRFLNNKDYLSVITKEALMQLTRNDDDRFAQAEEAAEMSIREYLSENYEIEQELYKGKFIAQYERSIGFPRGVYIYYNDEICEVIRPISGYLTPTNHIYWEEYFESKPSKVVEHYSQFNTYYPSDLVSYNDVIYKCLLENGYKFNNIRIPMVNGWHEAQTTKWEPKVYALWDVVKFNERFFTLMTIENFNEKLDPLSSACWGEIAPYDSDYNQYDLSGHDYVVHQGHVFYPETDVNSTLPELGKNLSASDPRNYNIKKHMVRLSIYELVKQIAPNNVSTVRMHDYEESMRWLNAASKLKLNPQIPRKTDETTKPTTDWQLATFQANYDPNNNPWLV